MPTYRIPVRADVRGHVVIEAANAHLALFALKESGFAGISDTEWDAWVDGEPVEVEP